MKFVIITHAIHKKKDANFFAYEPYVREMNLWCKYVTKLKIVAPLSLEPISTIEDKYKIENINLSKIPSFNIIGLKNKMRTLLITPFIIFKIFKAMFWANHIHLRCPGNIALLGCLVQIFFPLKKKTVKYAGNWDPNSKQPMSYRIQKKILSNTFLTRNCKVLVYGEWKNQSKNIIPFFTASYKEKEIIKIPQKNFSKLIKFIFVGAFSEGKQPILSVKIIEKLSQKYNVQLNMFGNGSQFDKVSDYVSENKLDSKVILHGNQCKEVIKKAYQESHFLIFISKSEGWPKVVAEAMFWKCLPISSNVSCVSYMLGNGKRGSVVKPESNFKDIIPIINNYIENEEQYQKQVLEAQKWSQNFTLDKFEKEIKKIIIN